MKWPFRLAVASIISVYVILLVFRWLKSKESNSIGQLNVGDHASLEFARNAGILTVKPVKKISAHLSESEPTEIDTTISPRKLKFFDIPLSGMNDFVPFLLSLLGCQKDSCLCGEKCTKNCPRLYRHCQNEPIKFAQEDDPSVFRAVILRHPVRRAVFSYITAVHNPMAMKFPKNVSLLFRDRKQVRPTLKQFVHFPCLGNGMTKMLAGLDPYDCYHVTDRILADAKATLQKLDFIGIKEHLSLSLKLLKSTLRNIGEDYHESAIKAIEVVSPVLGSDHNQFCLDKETEILLEKSNFYDLSLYQYALDLFHERQCKSEGTNCPPRPQLPLFPHFSSPFTKHPKVIALLHVPKAAGSAFVRVIRHFVGCSPECWCTGNCYSSCPYVINQCGHTPSVPDTCNTENVFTVILLRHPSNRTISAYKHARTVKGSHCCGLPDNVTARLDLSTSSLTLSQFALQPGVGNSMVKMLAGIPVDDQVTPVNGKVYEKAERRLRELSFIGLQEHYKESVKLFFYSLNKTAVPQPIDFEVHNVRRPQNLAITENDLKLIEKINSFDIQIYSLAKEIFYERLCSAGIHCYTVS